MHASVGPAGTGGYSPRATKSLQHTFHLPLDGAAVGLTLPPGEISAIVLRYEKDPVDVAHAQKLRGLTAMCECSQIARCTSKRYVFQVRALSYVMAYGLPAVHNRLCSFNVHLMFMLARILKI